MDYSIVSKKRPSYKSMTKCVLVSGHDGFDAVLDISPTMLNLTHCGKSYFRMTTGSYKVFDDGSVGALYLWDGWADQKLASKSSMPTSPADQSKTA